MHNEEEDRLNNLKIEVEVDTDEMSAMRIGFIRKVYGVVITQLILTAAVVCISFAKPVNDFLQGNMWLMWVTLAVSILLLFVMICFEKMMQQVPTNYIMLFSWTLLEGILVAYCTLRVDPSIVGYAAGGTIIIVGSLTIYAFYTKTDFTWIGGLLMVCSALLLIFGLGMMLFGTTKLLHMTYCLLGLFVFSMWLIYDTHLVMGKFGLKYNEDAYIFAALNIYLDIIQIFLYLLALLKGD